MAVNMPNMHVSSFAVDIVAPPVGISPNAKFSAANSRQKFFGRRGEKFWPKTVANKPHCTANVSAFDTRQLPKREALSEL